MGLPHDPPIAAPKQELVLTAAAHRSHQQVLLGSDPKHLKMAERAIGGRRFAFMLTSAGEVQDRVPQPASARDD